MSSHFPERRAELIAPRQRRPKTGDRAVQEALREQMRAERLALIARAAARRLDRQWDGADDEKAFAPINAEEMLALPVEAVHAVAVEPKRIANHYRPRALPCSLEMLDYCRYVRCLITIDILVATLHYPRRRVERYVAKLVAERLLKRVGTVKAQLGRRCAVYEWIERER